MGRVRAHADELRGLAFSLSNPRSERGGVVLLPDISGSEGLLSLSVQEGAPTRAVQRSL
jgi:hypothetical protein